MTYNSTSLNFELDENISPEKFNRTVDIPSVDMSSKDVIQLIGMDAGNTHMGTWFDLIWQKNVGEYSRRNISILCLHNESCYPLASMNITSGKHCLFKRIFISYERFHMNICADGYSIPGVNEITSGI